jgi:hypothetical protein
MKKHSLIPTLVTALLVFSAAHLHAAIVLNDTLVLDFGKTGSTTTGNWNNVAIGATGGTFPVSSSGPLVSSMIRYSDGAATGVTLSTTGIISGNPAGIGSATVGAVTASFPVTGAIPSSAQVDTAFIANSGVTLVLGNLNAALKYNLTIFSKLDAARDNLNIVINGTAIAVDPNVSPYLTTWSNIVPNGSNQIVISFPNAGVGTSNVLTQHINAFELTAVPEPSAALLGGLGMLCLLNRRRRL